MLVMAMGMLCWEASIPPYPVTLPSTRQWVLRNGYHGVHRSAVRPSATECFSKDGLFDVRVFHWSLVLPDNVPKRSGCVLDPCWGEM